jgi:hypothetical protein
MRRYWLTCAGIAVGVFSSLTTSALARDFVLTIGGGYSPLGNQVSIERNANYFRELVAERLPDARHDILFSDGKSLGRDVQYRAAEGSIPRSWNLLAQVFQQEKNWGMQYRNHAIPGVRGAATIENVAKWFKDVGQTAMAGDRVVIYATTHGGSSTNMKDPEDTALYLWNSQRLSVKDFEGYLSTLKPGVNVVLVMTQCHAGGFANAALDGPTMMGGSVRCGFFSTTFDRPAAGCSPDVDGDNEHEYSSYFWAALLGRGRDGRPLPVVDYDGDGGTSLAEAHTFAVINAESIDIPLRTSEAYLRRIAPSGASSIVGPYSIHMPYERLRDSADAAQLAAIESLSAELRLIGIDRGRESLDAAAQAAANRERADEALKETAGDYQRLCKNVRVSLVTRWPELANPWSAQVAEVVDEEGDAIVQAIEAHGDFAALQRLAARQKRLTDERWEHDRRYAKASRLARTLEDVAIVGNLRTSAPSEQWQRFEQLVAIENQKLLPTMSNRPAPELR